MRLTRVFCESPLAAGLEVLLPDAVSNHVARVLRLRAGTQIVAFDGSGRDYRCEVVAIEAGRVRIRVGEAERMVTESPLPVTLIQAVSRGERMDLTLQKATELGVAAIVPVLSARSVVRLDERQAAARLRHWQGVVASACEQCGRSVIPAVRRPVQLERHLAETAGTALRLVLNANGPESLVALTDMPVAVELLIGPEGGLEDGELASAARAGFQSVRLGPRILRTETAGVVALAVLQAKWGDLR